MLYGLVGVYRWTGDDVLHRRVVQGEEIIGLYNTFMNGVDKMD